MYKLSKTAKMPGKSFSLPASTCKMGSCLSSIKNSVCASCYAKKGSYCYPTTKNLRENNYIQYNSNPTEFYSALKTLIHAEYLKTGVPFFRWFDSGDLQSEEMLIDIIKIALDLPMINFWLPTKEYHIVTKVITNYNLEGFELPSNLNIRLSAYIIDGDYFNLPTELSYINQTRVITKDTLPLDNEQVCSGKCVSCNYKCWLSSENVAYVKH